MDCTKRSHPIVNQYVSESTQMYFNLPNIISHALSLPPIPRIIKKKNKDTRVIFFPPKPLNNF